MRGGIFFIFLTLVVWAAQSWAVDARIQAQEAAGSPSEAFAAPVFAPSASNMLPTAPLPPTPPASPAAAVPTGVTLTIGGLDDMGGPKRITTGLSILLLLTVLTLAPSILMMMTSFVRIVIVLGFIRRALSTEQVPPNQIIIGLALFLTLFVMTPTFKEVNNNALQPYIAGQLLPAEAYELAMEPIREFLFSQTRKGDLALFVRLAQIERPRTRSDVPSHVLIPAFMISELKTAFIIGFILFVPFLIIDIVVASILLSMGMMMLPPVIVSLPFKILLFVLVDGWNLIIGSLMRSF